MHKKTTAITVQVLEDVVAGSSGSQGWHVRPNCEKIPESRRKYGR
jgi:hypothetical protein